MSQFNYENITTYTQRTAAEHKVSCYVRLCDDLLSKFAMPLQWQAVWMAIVSQNLVNPDCDDSQSIPF